MSAQFSQPHLCGQRFSRSDGKGAVATGAVAAALVLSHLLQRTFGRGVRLERVRPWSRANENTVPRGFSVSDDERGFDAVGDRPLRKSMSEPPKKELLSIN